MIDKNLIQVEHHVIWSKDYIYPIKVHIGSYLDVIYS